MIRVVAGPPCAGKSTFIAERRKRKDVVVDLDTIARALGYPSEHIDHGDSPEHPAAAAARDARFDLVGRILNGKLRGRFWIIDTSPTRRMLTWYDRAGAKVIVLDPGAEVCHERADADDRPKATHAAIERWYSTRGLT